ncbi:S8 family serine peptidase [Deinococcus sp.]|uniref:S8 family serine peptidase n=1 Tax=Deinococcus sp. TaxID=47478 RepID=UPI0025B9ECB4|nr:S8 family serine peptidase [Deinococcus sp.]
MSRLALALTLALVGSPALALKLVPVPSSPAAPAAQTTTASLEIVPLPPGEQPPVQGPPLPHSVPSHPPPLPNQIPRAQALPGNGAPRDPLFARQWDMQAIDAPAAWAQFPAGKVGGPVTVAVLDTGYVKSPELAGRLINGYDFVHDPRRAGDGNGRDPNASGVGEFSYHGEIVANLIAAAHDGQGMAGLNPQARIVAVRVAGTDGLIDPADLIDGLRWAAGLPVTGVPANPNPARIINLSLFADFIPLTGCDPDIQKAIDEVTARGALIVAGAANDGKDSAGYSPAGCRNVLTLTSVDLGGQRPAYANWGKSVALAAPGGEPGHGIVTSSLSGAGGEREANGTSFAAPHATGVASLLLSVRPKLTPALLRELLTRTATPFPGGRCDPDLRRSCGQGILNAAAALRAALASNVGK